MKISGIKRHKSIVKIFILRIELLGGKRKLECSINVQLTTEKNYK